MLELCKSRVETLVQGPSALVQLRGPPRMDAPPNPIYSGLAGLRKGPGMGPYVTGGNQS